MKQVLHIFRKDARHYWRESLISIALMAAYAWYEMRGWTDDGIMGYSGFRGFLTFSSLSGLVSVLLPISWAIVIVRVIQGESLVGDRQFWITRPYEWKKLLAAKILFILAVVNLPLLIADIFLLSKAGFPPTHYLAGLLWMQLLLALFPFLIIAALATVTASLLQMALAVLIIVLYLIGMVSLSEQIPSSSFSSSIGDSVQTALLIGTCVVVILLQYSTRKTARSRWLIAGFAGTILLFLVGTPYRSVVAHQFPRLEAGQQSPVQLALLRKDELPTDESIDGVVADKEKEVHFQVPFSVSGVAEDSIVIVSGTMVGIEAPGGLHWDSGWRGQGMSLFPEQKRMSVDFSLKKTFLERVNSLPVKARFSLALTVYHDQNRREFVVPPGTFLMTEVGLCTAGGAGYSRGIVCRAALRTPPSLLITSDLSQTTCHAGKGESRAKPGEVARDWHQHSESGPAEFGISPVRIVSFYPRPANGYDSRTVIGICSGTKLILSNPEPVRSTRIELELNHVSLDDYRVRSGSVSFSVWK